MSIQKSVESIKNIFEVYQTELEKYGKHFSTDSFFYKKIIDLTDKIAVYQEQSHAKDAEFKVKIT